ATIDGGLDNDFIENTGASAILFGGSGVDTINNNASYVSINGGGGSNIINLNGGTGVTVNTSLGDDIISVASGITNFSVSGFSTSDTIKLESKLTSPLTIANGALSAGSLKIYGISSVYGVNNDWTINSSASTVTYWQHTVAGAVLGGGSTEITWNSLSESEGLFTITGLGSSTGIEVASGSTVVTLTSGIATVGNGHEISISSGYTFAIEGFSAAQMGSGWSLANNIASYADNWTLAGYQLGSGESSVTFYTNEGDSTVKLSLSGITSTNGFSAPNAGAVNLSASGFSSAVYVLSNGGSYALNLTGTVASGTTFNGLDTAADTITNAVAGLTIDGRGGNDSIYSGGNYATIDGGLGDDTIENYGESAYLIGGSGADYIYNNGTNATIDAGEGDDLIRNLASNVTIKTDVGSDTIQAYKDVQFTVTDFNNVYDVIQLYDGSDTVAATGLSAIDGGIVISDENNKSVTVYSVDHSAEGNMWTLNDTTHVARFGATTLQGAYLDGGVVKYRDSVEGATYLSLSGVTGTLANPISNIVTLGLSNFAG
ncbi:MAG: hypothetical protein J5497_01145, partial [Selenomonadaceae bacterium]|nr:hypothetical protein [Selenomonadaceae bacterium]